MRRHLLSIDDLSREDIERILGRAESFAEVSGREIKKVPTLRGRTVINLFYEASTRTSSSFELAAKRLSADLVNVKLAKCGSLGVAMEQLRRATDAGLGTMVGSMMETAIGVGAVAAVAAAHPTSVVDDLDAAWWAASSPVVGGVTYDGDRLMLPATAGSGVAEVVVTD